MKRRGKLEQEKGEAGMTKKGMKRGEGHDRKGKTRKEGKGGK